MTARIMRYGPYLVAVLAVVVVVSLLWVSMAAAQDQASAAQSAASTRPPSRKDAAAKPTPRSADGHPDFNGFYNGYDEYHGDPSNEKPGQITFSKTSDGDIFLDFYGANGTSNIGLKDLEGEVTAKESANQPSYKPEWKAKVDKIADSMFFGASNLDPWNNCKPGGVPRVGLNGAASHLQIVQIPSVTALIYEEVPGPNYRLIYTDGRQHPKDLDTSYMGHSIGHWDADTLVVDTVGLNDETWLGGGHATIHSDQEHVIEHWSRKGDVLTVQATVEDPVALTKPWVLNPQSGQIAASDDYIQPQMCVPKDVGHIVPASDKNPETCSYCVPGRVYGLAPSDKPASDQKNKGGAGGGSE